MGQVGLQAATPSRTQGPRAGEGGPKGNLRLCHYLMRSAAGAMASIAGGLLRAKHCAHHL